MDRKEALPTLPEIDSPPMSPKKQFRPMKTMDSYNSQEGRSVEELKALIKSVLQHNYQAFEEVRLKKIMDNRTQTFSVVLPCGLARLLLEQENFESNPGLRWFPIYSLGCPN